MAQTCNVENMTKWIEALESGEYPQDPNGGSLKTDAGFCCLGVLEDIAGAKWGPAPGLGRYETQDGLTAMPSSRTLLGFLGLPTGPDQDTVIVHDPEVGFNRGVHILNDIGKTFAHIAGLLRTEFNIPKAE